MEKSNSNMSEEKPIIIKLDFHKAVNTRAQTLWKVLYGYEGKYEYDLEKAEGLALIKLLYSTKTAGKTHWFAYYRVNPYAYLKFKRIRISNRGNIIVSIHGVGDLKVEGEELNNILNLISIKE
jgi:hypothetical protein